MTTDEGAERGALQEQETRSTDRTYGTRFIDRLKSLGSVSSMRYADIQRIMEADREGMIEILRRRYSTMPYALIRAIRDREPEDVAEDLHRDRQMMLAFLLLALA